MFTGLRIRGAAASILWGYRPAVTLRAWSITKIKGQWTLTAAVERADAFMCRQKPLLFTAPREGTRDGFWSWGIESITMGTSQLRAILGPPEQ